MTAVATPNKTRYEAIERLGDFIDAVLKAQPHELARVIEETPSVGTKQYNTLNGYEKMTVDSAHYAANELLGGIGSNHGERMVRDLLELADSVVRPL